MASAGPSEWSWLRLCPPPAASCSFLSDWAKGPSSASLPESFPDPTPTPSKARTPGTQAPPSDEVWICRSGFWVLA